MHHIHVVKAACAQCEPGLEVWDLAVVFEFALEGRKLGVKPEFRKFKERNVQECAGCKTPHLKQLCL